MNKFKKGDIVFCPIGNDSTGIGEVIDVIEIGDIYNADFVDVNILGKEGVFRYFSDRLRLADLSKLLEQYNQ